MQRCYAQLVVVVGWAGKSSGKFEGLPVEVLARANGNKSI